MAYLSPHSAIYLMLGSWLDQGQDFREPLQFPCWMVRLATGHINFGDSNLEGHAYLLPGHLEPLKDIEPEQKGEGTAVWEDCLC